MIVIIATWAFCTWCAFMCFFGLFFSAFERTAPLSATLLRWSIVVPKRWIADVCPATNCSSCKYNDCELHPGCPDQ